VRIRPETEADRAAIWAINEQAFGETVVPELVDVIRASARFVPELSLVAEKDGELVGHVMLSYVDLEPGSHRVLQVGPLAVLPPHQRRGIGGKLMEEAIRLADARGEPLLLIEGNPRYYERFGFIRSGERGIEPPPAALGPQYFMVRPLAAYDPGLRGQAVYPPETFGTLP
jgi:putative acetyltransferase